MAIAFQDSEDYRLAIKAIGCEYLCIGAMAAKITRRTITSQLINMVWDTLIEEELADSKLGLHTSLSYYRAFDMLFDYLGFTTYCGDQIGSIIDGVPYFYGWVKHEHFHFIIRRLQTSTGALHSVLLDRNFNLLYNSAPSFPGGETTGLFLFHVAQHAPNQIVHL